MNTKSIASPGFTTGALALASGTDFMDAALGLADVLGGIAGPMAAIDGPSLIGAAGNPIATVDKNPAPRANEV